MSQATDRLLAALEQLNQKAAAHVAKRSEAANAASEFTSAQVEVDAALEAVRAEKETIVAGTAQQ
jgi:hypothetical protein